VKAAAASQSYFGLVGTVVAHPLSVLVHFIHQHFSCAEVKSAQVHRAPQVACQLRLASELFTTWAAKKITDRKETRREIKTLWTSIPALAATQERQVLFPS